MNAHTPKQAAGSIVHSQSARSRLAPSASARASCPDASLASPSSTVTRAQSKAGTINTTPSTPTNVLWMAQ